MYRPGPVDLRMAAAVWTRNLVNYRHTWKRNIFPNFFEPVVFLVGMGLGLGSYLSGGVEGQVYLVYLAPGLMAANAMNGASLEVTWNMFVKMNMHRLYDAYLTTPCEVEDIGFGELLWSTTRALIYGVGFLVVVLALQLLGYEILRSWTALLLPLALALTGWTFGLIGQLYTATIRVIDLYSYYYSLFLTPLFLFSDVFFPVSRLPAGAEIASLTPLYHCVRLVRACCTGELGGACLVSLGYLVALSLVLMVVVPRRLRARLLG
ncbi:MAG: ABC transporter permease [Planctomycetota bacterium]